MSIEGQCNFFTIYFPGFVCFVLYQAKISGERLQDFGPMVFPAVTLKNKSRSKTPNQFSIMSKCYIHADFR